MKLIDKAFRREYRFDCPHCGNRIEAAYPELTDVGGGVGKFFCPVCRQDRFIDLSVFRKKIVYEEEIKVE
jgi:predicted RNA-binding Zn-ribbon protein involved in translation (DUF1610 family)